ncbi:unnamed protein product [Arctogadus glacialis]
MSWTVVMETLSSCHAQRQFSSVQTSENPHPRTLLTGQEVLEGSGDPDLLGIQDCVPSLGRSIQTWVPCTVYNMFNTP